MAEAVFEPSRVYTELLLGAGKDRRKFLAIDDRKEWSNLITLDIDPSLDPDVVHDLNNLPLPFIENEFDEIHAYEVLEHIGSQGDWKSFFALFDELWRIIRDGGLLYATVPSWDSIHAYGDPGHTRVINESTIAFLDRKNYEIEGTPMTDYRPHFKSNWTCEAAEHRDQRFLFCMRAIK